MSPDPSSLSPENISSLIEHILKEKDPATVGLRKIIRRRAEEASDFPLHQARTEEFDVPGKKRNLTEDEQRVLELEKQVAELRNQLKNTQESARNAVQTAYVKGKKEGFEDGLRQGKTEASEEFEKSVNELQDKINSYLKTFEESRRAIFSNSEHVMIKFCCELAKKIIVSEVSTRNDIILSVLKRALTYIGDREKLVVRVAPDDMEKVSGRKDFWIPVSDRLKDITIESDERIERGGCIIESNSGMVDARLGVQFSELSDLVEKVWESVNSSFVNEKGQS